MTATREIPGTPLFNANASRRGYALNTMCYSFNHETNREQFTADPVAYCHRYGLSDEMIELVKAADVLALVKSGGSIYYLAKLAGILGWDVQDVGAQQTGMTKDEFQAMLVAAGS